MRGCNLTRHCSSQQLPASPLELVLLCSTEGHLSIACCFIHSVFRPPFFLKFHHADLKTGTIAGFMRDASRYRSLCSLPPSVESRTPRPRPNTYHSTPIFYTPSAESTQHQPLTRLLVLARNTTSFSIPYPRHLRNTHASRWLPVTHSPPLQHRQVSRSQDICRQRVLD
jgi:hypothetical protein